LGGLRQDIVMVRHIAIVGLAAAMLGCLPAYGQEGEELEGAPGWQKTVKPAPVQKKPAAPVAPIRTQTPPQKTQAQAPADKLKAEQVKLAQHAEAQKAEQARLAKQAAELKALQARIDARAAELAAEEKRLAQLRADQEAEQASKLAALDRERDEAGREETSRSRRQTADLSVEPNGVRPDGEPDRNAGDDETADDAIDDLPDATPKTRRPVYARLDFENAERSCARAGEDAALARNFYSARYDSMPNIFQDGGWELRGRMRLQDRRGFLIVDTVCEVDADGEAQHFAFLR
jgi:hypothetical protein